MKLLHRKKTIADQSAPQIRFTNCCALGRKVERLMALCLQDHAVIIASVNRPAILRDTIASLRCQTARPGQIIIAVPNEEDVPEHHWKADDLEIIIARKGLTTQRNDALDSLAPQINLVSFFDDDIELEPGYLAAVHNFLAHHSEVVLVDGIVLKDGKVSRAEAIRILSEASPAGSGFTYTRNVFGCNMTVRRGVAEIVRFDERLRLYAWLEDADFTRRCLAHGRSAQYEGARIIHLHTPSGRINDGQVGFAQIMNSYYLMTKGHMSFVSLLEWHWGRALAANLWGTLIGDPATDRLGRLKGNFVALSFLARGRCEPEHVEHL